MGTSEKDRERADKQPPPMPSGLERGPKEDSLERRYELRVRLLDHHRASTNLFRQVPSIGLKSPGRGTNLILFLFDKEEGSDRHMLEINFQLGTPVLTLGAINTIPANHLLSRERDKILKYLRRQATNQELSFVNHFVPGFSSETLHGPVRDAFNEAASEALGSKYEVDEKAFREMFDRTSWGDIETLDDLKKPAVEMMQSVGLDTTMQEAGLTGIALKKLQLIKGWAQKLVDKGVFPDTVLAPRKD